jgi:hypothetical protein
MRVSIDTAVQRCEVRKVVQKVRGCRPCAGFEIHDSTYVVVVVIELKGFAPPLFFSCSCSSLGGAALESPFHHVRRWPVMFTNVVKVVLVVAFAFVSVLALDANAGCWWFPWSNPPTLARRAFARGHGGYSAEGVVPPSP